MLLRTTSFLFVISSWLLFTAPNVLGEQVSVLLTRQPPAVDGNLDEAPWAQAKEYALNFTYGGDTEVKTGTRFKVLRDDEALYFGITCYEPEIGKTKRDAVEAKFVYADDCVEIFLEPSGQGKTCFQYMINSAGVMDRYSYTRLHGESLRYSTPGLVAKGALLKDRWTLEVRIPFVDLAGVDAAIDADARPSADSWHFNIVRNRSMDGEMTSFTNQRSNWLNTALYAGLENSGKDFRAYEWGVGRDIGLRVEVAKGTFQVKGGVKIENRTGRTARVSVNHYLLTTSGEKIPLTSVSDIPLADKANTLVPFSAALLKAGDYLLVGEVRMVPGGVPVRIFTRSVSISPSAIKVSVVRPYYRSAIYHTMEVKNIAVQVAKLYEIALDGISLALMDEDQKVLASKKYGKTDNLEGELTLPIPKLEPGRYTVVAVGSSGGQETAKAEAPLHVYGPSKYEVRVNENLNLVINGQEVFPVGFFGGDPCLNQIAGGAINFAVCYTFDEKFNIGQLYHQSGIFSVAYPWPVQQCYGDPKFIPLKMEPLSKERAEETARWAAQFRDTEGVAGWYLADEPEPSRHAPAFLEGAYNAMREGDPFHPCFISFMSPSEIPIYRNAFDVMGIHCYPGYSTHGLEQPMTIIADYVEAMKAHGGGKVACWLAPQALLSAGGPAAPIPYDVERCMTFLALAHGVKGIYWAYAEDVREGTELRFGMPYLIKEVRSLEKFVLSPQTVPVAITQAPDKPVHALAKEVGDDLTLLLVNVLPKEVECSFRLPGRFAATREMSAVSEDRALPSNEGMFFSKLKPYGVQILTTDRNYPRLEPLERIDQVFQAERDRLMRSGNLCYAGRGATVTTNSSMQRFINAAIGGYFDRRAGFGWQSYKGTWMRVSFASPQTVGRVVFYCPNLGNISTRLFTADQMGTVLTNYRISFLVDGEWVDFKGRIEANSVTHEARPGEFITPFKFDFAERTHVLDVPLKGVRAIKLTKLEDAGIVSGIMAYEK